MTLSLKVGMVLYLTSYGISKPEYQKGNVKNVRMGFLTENSQGVTASTVTIVIGSVKVKSSNILYISSIQYFKLIFHGNGCLSSCLLVGVFWEISLNFKNYFVTKSN